MESLTVVSCHRILAAESAYGAGRERSIEQGTIATFSAKRLLTRVHYEEGAYFPADYTMNLYRGCNHGCIYCDTRSECYGIDRFDEIRYKDNCLAMLEAELRQKRKPGVVSLGAASDSYNAAENTLGLTRQALQLLKRYSFGVGIPTKGDLVARDTDILAEMGRAAPVYVSFSITTAEDGISRLLEPGAPASSRRFAAMKELAAAGILVGTWLNPMLPFLTDSDDNLLALVDETAASGGRFALCHFGMTLRGGNREYFYAALEKEPRFQGVKQRYVNAFGLRYECASPRADRLWLIFQERCEKRKLLYRFKDIARAAGEYGPTQMKLFVDS